VQPAEPFTQSAANTTPAEPWPPEPSRFKCDVQLCGYTQENGRNTHHTATAVVEAWQGHPASAGQAAILPDSHTSCDCLHTLTRELPPATANIGIQ